MNSKTAVLIGSFLALNNVGASGVADVEQLNWISGHWCSNGDGERIEEIWLPVHGQMMLGMSRTLDGDRTNSFEYIRIVMEDQVPTYVAQPGGRPPVGFQRSAGGKNWVRFENPKHDFPQRIEYRREGNSLHAKIAGPGEGGKDFEIPFEYDPC